MLSNMLKGRYVKQCMTDATLSQLRDHIHASYACIAQTVQEALALETAASAKRVAKRIARMTPAQLEEYNDCVDPGDAW